MEGRPPARRATIRDVASRAGVGTMTVSRVATGRGYVSPETRQKVEEAIAELGYLPNRNARGMRSRRSGILALLVSDITNPYFTTLARGIEDEAKKSDSLLLIASSDEEEEEEIRAVRRLVERGVDGIVIVPSRDGREAAALAQRSGVPCVTVDRRGPREADCIRADSRGGAASLARLLLDEGHQRAAVLAGMPGISTSEDRVAGFLEAFSEGGGRASAAGGRFEVEAGRAMAREAIQSQARPTALFAVNNFLAIGALQALAELGLRVPDDVSVVGFDDLPAELLIFPFLTVATQPVREMGVLACQRLLARQESPQLAPEEIILPTSLLRRASTGPPPR